jgi:hypothetical protein
MRICYLHIGPSTLDPCHIKPTYLNNVSQVNVTDTILRQAHFFLSILLSFRFSLKYPINLGIGMHFTNTSNESPLSALFLNITSWLEYRPTVNYINRNNLKISLSQGMDPKRSVKSLYNIN